MKKINVKETILSEIKNVELVSVKNFELCSYYTKADVTVSFDIHGRHCGCTKEYCFSGLFLDGWHADECWYKNKAEELGITVDEMFDNDDYYYSDDLADEWREYICKCIEDNFCDWVCCCSEDCYNDELMKIAKEYIEDNINDFYRLEDTGYSLNFETDMSKLFVFDEFVGYVITEDFGYEFTTELYDKA